MKIWKIVDDEEKVKISDDGEVSLKAEVLLLTSTSTNFDKFTPEAKEIVSLNFAGISHFVDTVKSENPDWSHDRVVAKAVSVWARTLKTLIKAELKELNQKRKDGLLYGKKSKAKSKKSDESTQVTQSTQPTPSTSDDDDDLTLGF